MITKRGKLWYSDFEVAGQRVRRTLKTIHEAEAKVRSQQLFEKLSAGHEADGTEVTIGYVIDYTMRLKWKKLRDHKKAGLCELVKARLGADTPVSQITKRVLRELQETMGDEGSSKSTINKYTNVVTGALRYFYDREELETAVPRVARFKEPETKVRFLTDEEMAAMLVAEPDFRLRTYWQAAMEIGSRTGDCRTMLWADFDWVNGTYVVGNGKVDKPQAVPLNRTLLDAFQALKDAGHERPFDFTNNQIRVGFRRIKRLSGVDDKRVTPNTMRHTCATQLLASGADLKEVQMWMGHSKITTTQRYTQVMPQRLMRLRDTARKPLESVPETVS
jgi:integrase